MSTTPLPVTNAPPPRQARKRIYIPLILLMLFLGLGLGFIVRGSWPDTLEKNPSGPADGTITQLLQKPNGNVVVRCAVIVAKPPKDVWAVVTDYDRHNTFLPYVSEVKATKDPDGRLLIDGVAHSRLWGDWPFQSLTTHKESVADGEYHARWSEMDRDVFKVNRGEWSVTPHAGSKDQTLLAFTLQIELKDHPNFIVRNIIMDRLHLVLKAMRDEAMSRTTKS